MRHKEWLLGLTRALFAAVILVQVAGCGTAGEESREDIGEVTQAATVPGGLVDSSVATGLTSPTALALLPDGRVFVTEQAGRVKVIVNDVLQAANFIDISSETASASERGLLGVAVDPNFSTNRFVYLYHTANAPAEHNRLIRVTASASNPNVADLSTKITVIDFENTETSEDTEVTATWHHGGALHFGADGKLYVAMGDHRHSAYAQSLSSTKGKILRFTINSNGTYSIPSDNPFLSQTTGLRQSIYRMGLRNPFTFAIRPGTNDLFINDVGNNSREEVNVALVSDPSNRRNFGWPATEGDFSQTSFPNYKRPAYAYAHGTASNQGCSIVGGTFYPASGPWPSQYHDTYFFMDFCAGQIRTMDPDTFSVATFATGLSFPIDLAATVDGGSIYYLQRGQQTGTPTAGLGSVRKITVSGGAAPVFTDHPQNVTAHAEAGDPAENATFSCTAVGTPTPSIQWQRNNGSGYSNISGATSSSYTRVGVVLSDNGALFRCRANNGVGGDVFSQAATLTVTSNDLPVPTMVAPALESGTISSVRYESGMEISFSGSATDEEDGTLPASAFSWLVDYHHDTHSHPHMALTTGVRSGSFFIPVASEADPLVWYRLYMTVTDSGGRSSTIHRDILPGTMLSDLTWTSATNFWGPVELDTSVGEQAAADGLPITLDGFVFPKGLGTHAPSEIVYNLNGECSGKFLAHVGIDDEVTAPEASVIFRVYLNGSSTPAWASGVLGASSPREVVDVNIAGVNALRLVVDNAGTPSSNPNHSDHADWANARVTGCGLEPPAGLPSPWLNTDVGAVAATGSASAAGNSFSIDASGADIWSTADEFHFVYQTLVGDGEITARVTGVENTNAWAKAGVMIRESLSANAKNAMMHISASNGARFQRRTSTGGSSTSSASASGGESAPYWVRLVRSGSTFTGYVSSNGSSWTTVASDTISMASSVHIGLAVTSHADGTVCTAGFDNVSVQSSSCTPTTCSAQGAECGTISDGCGGSLNCGSCGTGESCSSNQCVCTPTTCSGQGAECGTISDGCGGNLNCGSCGTGETCSSNQCVPTGGSLPSPWVNGDVGAVAVTGSASHSSGAFTIDASGADIWGSADEFHFVYQTLSGDGEITARVATLENTNAWAKGGVMIRESLAANSKNAMTFISATKGARFQRRTATGGSSTSTPGAGGESAPYWVRLVRSGSTFTGYVSSNGTNWNLVASDTISMATDVYIGLALTSHVDGTLCTSTLDNVNVQTSSCSPTTCSAEGAECGTINDGCGGNLSCGSCGTGETCSGNQCVPSGGNQLIQFEAESGSGASTSPMQIVSDPAASDGAAVVNLTSSSNSSPPANGHVTYNFSVGSAGTYNVWGRFLVGPADDSDDSLWVRMDSGSWILWNNIYPRLGNAAYGWDQVHNSQASDAIVQFNLSAGSHTLEIAYRENGLYIDEFQITNDLAFTPVGPSFPAGNWQSQDVGAVSAAGSFSESGGTFTVTGSGADIWGSADEFHFAYQQMTGDGTLIARVNTFGSNCSAHAHARGAVMMRNDLSAGAVRIMTAAAPVASSLYRLIWRSTANSSSSAQTGGDSNPPVWVRLIRSGNTFTGATSTNGTSWTALGTSQTLSMSSTIYVGLAVTSHSDGNLCTVTFDNVSIQ